MQLLLIGIFIVIVFVVLIGGRYRNHRADRIETDRLLALQPVSPMRFEYSMIADLPVSAQRYFMFTNEQGAPLLPVVELSMLGLFSLGARINRITCRCRHIRC